MTDRLHIYLPPKQIEELKTLAKQERRSVSGQASLMLERALRMEAILGGEVENPTLPDAPSDG